jgi:hypothetical protein
LFQSANVSNSWFKDFPSKSTILHFFSKKNEKWRLGWRSEARTVGGTQPLLIGR